jgi:hypothetical protein
MDSSFLFEEFEFEFVSLYQTRNCVRLYSSIIMPTQNIFETIVQKTNCFDACYIREHDEAILSKGVNYIFR